MELPSASFATQKACEQTTPLARRTLHHHTLHLRVVRDQPPVAFVSVPIDIALVMLAQQYYWFSTLTPMTSGLVRATVNHPCAGRGAAEGVRPGVNRVAQDFVNRVVNLQSRQCAACPRPRWYSNEGSASVSCRNQSSTWRTLPNSANLRNTSSSASLMRESGCFSIVPSPPSRTQSAVPESVPPVAPWKADPAAHADESGSPTPPRSWCP